MSGLQTTVTRRYRFCASHRLHSDMLTGAENERVYGKCNNPYGHGHDYVLDVSVTGTLNLDTGLILRLRDLDDLVKATILDGFAYKNLNRDVTEFARLVPTTENVAAVIADRLRESWNAYFPYSSAWLSGISMQETERNSFEVRIAKADVQTRTPSLPDHINESVIVNA